MIYHGVIVDILTRSTSLITGDYPDKPDKEHAGMFCFCKWFKALDKTKNGAMYAEYMALVYEIEIIKMFQRLDKTSPSKFSEYAKKVTA